MTGVQTCALRSEEHTSELQSHDNLVCRLLLEKKNITSRSGATAPLSGQRSWSVPSEPPPPRPYYARGRAARPDRHRPTSQPPPVFFLKNPAPPKIYPLPHPAPFPA